MLTIDVPFIAKRICFFLFNCTICIFGNILIYNIINYLEFPLREFLIGFFSLYSLEQLLFLIIIIHYIKNLGKTFIDYGDFNYWKMKFPVTNLFRMTFILENIANIIYSIFILVNDFPKVSYPIQLFFQLVGYFSIFKFAFSVIYLFCCIEKTITKKMYNLAYGNFVIIHINERENTIIEYPIKIHSKKDVKDDCSICLNNNIKEKWVKLECGHFYHLECLKPWFFNNNSCPTCRQTIATFDI